MATHFGVELPVADVRQKFQKELADIELYRRAANYIAAASIYLKDNFWMREPLKPEHIKERLLGHWGTVPGINLLYAHLNRLIKQHDLDCFLVTGPGHGAPANLANLYLEGAIGHVYEDYPLTGEGLSNLIKGFSWPGGFPSHVNAETPGSIHEGGELGYALAVSFGAVMDNPDLIVACIVGDGESETGPTATAWHSYKFIDPRESGAVLPIVHINGYKISNPTIYGTMSDEELYHLFTGYGYNVRFVKGPDYDADMWASIDWAYTEIRRIQHAARSGNPILRPKWPVLLLQSPKGMSGIKEVNGVPIEGSFRSHQVPVKECKTEPHYLKLVEDWLLSYKPQELFESDGTVIKQILDLPPKGDRRMGCNPHTLGGKKYTPLKTPGVLPYAVAVDKARRGEAIARGTLEAGKYVRDLIGLNPSTFRLVSPDELESNQFQAVFEKTNRDYQWPVHKFDTFISNQNGRVLEILSEHTCQGWLQGYLLTGRHGMFPSYEAFLGIIGTMMDQYAKFLKMARALSWRHDLPSLNYIETSTLWRQEHNGFSHQNPGFINTLLNKKSSMTRCYFPPDANTLLCTLDHCMRSKNYINLIVAGKQPAPQWLDIGEAIDHARAGASIWRWASVDDGINPDVVLVGIGCETTIEVLAASVILRQRIPELRVRVVNITDLMVLEQNSEHPHGLNNARFEALLTKDKPVIINFHGYPSAVKQLLFGRDFQSRFHVHGYSEEGTTTTPFDMLVVNGTSRYHIAKEAAQLAVGNPAVAVKVLDFCWRLEYELREHQRYIRLTGDDPKEITNFKFEWK